LIHSERDARLLAEPHDLDGLRIVHPQRLLREHTTNMLLVLHDFLNDGQLCVGRHGNIDHFDRFVGEHFLVGRIHLETMPFGHARCMRRGSRGNRHGIEPRRFVGDKMAVGHDEAAADAADPKVAAFRQPGQVVEFKRNRHGCTARQ
jgi:hypothetical protein